MGAWDRSGVRKATAPAARGATAAASARAQTGAGVPQPVYVDDDELEWQTASWARNDEKAPTKEGTGKGTRVTGKTTRKARMNEGDRILERINKGDLKLDAPDWEGGGRVDRDNRSNAARKGKKGWPSR